MKKTIGEIANERREYSQYTMCSQNTCVCFTEHQCIQKRQNGKYQNNQRKHGKIIEIFTITSI